MDCRSLKKGISIIGTGDFGRSIGKRLVITGYDVTFGSRRPEVRNLRADDKVFVNTVVTSVGEALRKNSIIVFAVRAIHFEEVISKFRTDLSGKLIIDVSNKSRRDRYLTSNAEMLQNLVPEATVVKAFNVISAYAMEADFDGSSRLVPVASNSCKARSKVKDIARSMGFQPFDAGMLTSSRDIEMYVHWLFPKWQFPILLTVLIMITWWLHVVYVYYVQSETYTWEQLFVKVSNKPLAMTAVTILSLTYMPGCLAGFLQLRNGTKHRRFPWWLDSWLKARKQLGLICFFLVCLHVCISVLLMSPTYFHSWFHGTEHDMHGHHVHNGTQPKPDVEPWMTWKGEIASLLGILTYALMCVLAVTSIPSVAETLNWVEWHFIQSKLRSNFSRVPRVGDGDSPLGGAHEPQGAAPVHHLHEHPPARLRPPDAVHAVSAADPPASEEDQDGLGERDGQNFRFCQSFERGGGACEKWPGFSES
ncbi:metalloreductase STEAP4-like [Physella acuta]|uniref:metalloreductase STEAP4-like n=1 Tax=Physella acuta TaxID=109671 RepID=UPI0027DE3D08|nr:metalloreductase STEAP4-like [Physella acuta]